MRSKTKLAIPVILATTILVAGIFAFQPIQEASTVHNTIIGAGGDLTLNIFDINGVVVQNARIFINPAFGGFLNLFL